MLDDMNFFHQATIRICGSLEADKVVQQCFEFLKEFMPLSGMMMSTLEPEFGAIRILALSSHIHTKPWTTPVMLSTEAKAALKIYREKVFLQTWV